MAKWDGEERRVDASELKTNIALIKQKTEFIEEKLTSFIESYSVVKLVTNEEFKAHSTQDRWMFALIITILIGIFVKIMFL